MGTMQSGSGSDSERERNRLWLIGSMGAGKTTVASAVSLRLGWPVLDNDVELRRETGRSTVALAAAGANQLHASESEQLHHAVRKSGPFIAGVAASVADRPSDLRLLQASGFVVYLRATAATLAARVGAGQNRPWLTQNPEAWLATRILQRGPAYEQAADLIVDVDGLSTDQIAVSIVSALDVNRSH